MGAFQAGLILLRIDKYPKVNELSGTDVLVLAALFSFAADEDQPQAFASAAKIAGRTRLGRRTVQRSLEHMEDIGVIDGEHRTRRPTRWSLDPFFLRTTSVAPTPVGPGTTSATRSPTSATATPGIRQSGARQASQRRQPGVTVAHQCTEVGSEAKRRNRTDVPGGSTSHDGSAPLAVDSATPPADEPTADTERAPQSTEAEPPWAAYTRAPYQGTVNGKQVTPDGLR